MAAHDYLASYDHVDDPYGLYGINCPGETNKENLDRIYYRIAELNRWKVDQCGVIAKDLEEELSTLMQYSEEICECVPSDIFRSCRWCTLRAQTPPPEDSSELEVAG